MFGTFGSNVEFRACDHHTPGARLESHAKTEQTAPDITLNDWLARQTRPSEPVYLQNAH